MHVNHTRTYQRKKMFFFFLCFAIGVVFLGGRIWYLMIIASNDYRSAAIEQQQRERKLRAPRGEILDRNGVVLATNKTVCNISVVHNQITDAEAVISCLSQNLEIPEKVIRKKVEKVTSIEKIKGNVDIETGLAIMNMHLDGIKVDEEYKRVYPYNDLASKVIGFTGSDNQGILGLEAKYDQELLGVNGSILTYTDARGREIADAQETMVDSLPGKNLYTSLDVNIQSYCQQAAEKAMIKKQADGVEIIALSPQTGEIYAMVDYPEYNLNEPFEVPEEILSGIDVSDEKALLDAQNQMWRNWCVSDTYEPGSIFKCVTTSAALEAGVVSLEDQFYCPGYYVVEDRKIHCHKTTGHGSETFIDGICNSCNPVFIQVGMRLGADRFYSYMNQFGLLDKTNIDLAGEATTLMHKRDEIGPVELATISFGQTFQVTPIQMATTVSSLINGGTRITPHFAVATENTQSHEIYNLSYGTQPRIVSEETSETLRDLLYQVVAVGGGKKAAVEGYEIGGKTATSQTLPRSEHKYISSFIGFWPVENPKILVMVIIRNPQGVYYGGTIAAPVAREIFENVLPYLE